MNTLFIASNVIGVCIIIAIIYLEADVPKWCDVVVNVIILVVCVSAFVVVMITLCIVPLFFK